MEDTSFVIYVCDSNEKDRLEDDNRELQRILNKDYFTTLENVVILVFANKQDLPNARSIHQLAANLKIHELAHGRPYYIQPCVAVTGEGIQEVYLLVLFKVQGFEWLSDMLEHRGQL